MTAQLLGDLAILAGLLFVAWRLLLLLIEDRRTERLRSGSPLREVPRPTRHMRDEAPRPRALTPHDLNGHRP